MYFIYFADIFFRNLGRVTSFMSFKFFLRSRCFCDSCRYSKVKVDDNTFAPLFRFNGCYKVQLVTLSPITQVIFSVIVSLRSIVVKHFTIL